METTNLHITEYIGNQEIDFFGITSFKVQNHGEAVIDVNSIAIYPGQTVKIIEEDGTKCDFRLSAKFSESGKMPKFRAIYKKFGTVPSIDTLQPPNTPYLVQLLNYELGDQFECIANKSGHTILRRSFQSDSFDNLQFAFPDAYAINLGFVEAATVVKYIGGGSLDTHAIMFRNNTTSENSEIFMVNGNVMPVESPVAPPAGEPFYNVRYVGEPYLDYYGATVRNIGFTSNVVGAYYIFTNSITDRHHIDIIQGENIRLISVLNVLNSPIIITNYASGEALTFNNF